MERIGKVQVHDEPAPVDLAQAPRPARPHVESGAVFRMDMKRVKARKDEMVGRSSHGVERSLESLKGTTVY